MIIDNIDVGQVWEIKDYGLRFIVLCVDDGECFVRWADGGFHGVLNIEQIIKTCRFTYFQTDCPWK